MQAYAFQLVAAAVFLWVGVRLVRLSRHTGESPEKLLGLHFFCSGLAYLAWVIPTLFQLEEAKSRIDLTLWFDIVPWAIYDLGIVPLLLFARLVFRPDATWGKWLVATCTLMLLSATTMWFAQQQPGVYFYSVESPWYWCNLFGYAIPYVWLAIEAFLAHSAARRRARIGLCSRVVVNRYLLFGFYGVDQVALCVADLLQTMEVTGGGDGVVSPLFDFAIGSIEVAGVAILFFVFFPPKFYREWLEGQQSAPSTSAGMG